MTPLSRAERDAFMRLDFFTFLHRVFASLHPGKEFVPAWSVEITAWNLDEVRKGNTRRLIVNQPPRSLKSVSASVAFVAWILGHDPTAAILCVSYGQDLAEKHARDTKLVMSQDWYRRLFPKTQLSSRKSATHDFETTRGGYRLSASVGGPLTGRGADFIIIDDPQKPDETLSEVSRRGVKFWYDNTLQSRLNDHRTGAIVLVMQRLHEDDLVGHLLQREEWKHLKFAAIAEEYERHEIETPFDRYGLFRLAGQELDPIRQPLAKLEEIRRNVGEYTFAGQYQQAPVPLGGGMVKREWFLPYRAADLPEGAEVVESWDTANKVCKANDYSVCTTWVVVGTKAYLRDVRRERLEYPDLKRAVREQQQLYRASTVLIEDMGSGIQLIQELRHEGLFMVSPYRSQLSKVDRMHAQTATLANGFVFVPEAASWLDAYLQELSTFPFGRHDDQADSTSQFLEWLKQRMFYAAQPLFGVQVGR